MSSITNSRPATSEWAIWSLALGILATPPFPFGFLAGIPAIVLGHRALARLRETAERGRGLAITGIVLGYLSILLSAALIGLILMGILRP